MLRVSLLGNLGADPEVRYSQKGVQVVSFRVAVNQVRTGPDGERQENTEWFRVRVSNRQAEFAQRLGKGTRVFVVGRLDIGHYTAKDGDVRTSFDVWADDIQSLTPRGSGDVFAASGSESEVEPADSSPSRVPVAASPATSSRAVGNGKVSRSAPAASAPGTVTLERDDREDLPF